MFQCPSAEVIGQSLDRLIPQSFGLDDSSNFLAIDETGATTRETNNESPIQGVRANGEKFPLEASISEVEVAGQKLVTAILRDITEREALEAKLKEQAQILDLAPVLIRDLAGRILLWNTGAENLYGWSSSEALGKVKHSLLRTEFPIPLKEIRAVLFAQGHWEGELVHTKRNGGRIVVLSQWVLHKGAHDEPKAVLEINTDITERKRAEAITERLAGIVETAEESIFSKTIDGVITTWNHGAERLYGYTSAEAIGKSVSMLIPPDRPDELSIILARLKREEHIKQFETVRMDKHGVRIDISLTVSPIKGGSGAVTGASTISRNITERKRAEDEIRRLNETLECRVRERTDQLEAANKELEAFSYSVSHDLRAPLRHINGFSLALLEDYEDKLDATGKGYLNEVRGATHEMAQLIDDLLQLARVTRSEMRREVVSLSDLVRSTVTQLQERDRGRTVNLKIEEGLFVQGDKRLLHVMLVNLLGNAWKFTSKREQSEIVFGCEEKDSESIFFVSDNGAGFDMAFVAKLFGTFQRLHSTGEFEGTGIGLATVQRIVNRHGGRVWATGAVDQGATIYFTLPVRNKADGA